MILKFLFIKIPSTQKTENKTFGLKIPYRKTVASVPFISNHFPYCSDKIYEKPPHEVENCSRRKFSEYNTDVNYETICNCLLDVCFLLKPTYSKIWIKLYEFFILTSLLLCFIIFTETIYEKKFVFQLLEFFWEILVRVFEVFIFFRSH